MLSQQHILQRFRDVFFFPQINRTPMSCPRLDLARDQAWRTQRSGRIWFECEICSFQFSICKVTIFVRVVTWSDRYRFRYWPAPLRSI